MTMAPADALMEALETHWNVVTMPVTGLQRPGDLAAHIAKGWEEMDRDILYPTIVIDAPISGERAARNAAAVRLVQPADPQDPTVQAFYSVGSLEIPLQVNVFARTRTQRSELVHAIDVSLSGLVGKVGGQIALPLPDYYDTTAVLRREGMAQYLDDQNAVGRDEWRALLTVEAGLEEIVSVDEARMIAMELNWVINFGESDTQPLETLNAFEPPSP